MGYFVAIDMTSIRRRRGSHLEIQGLILHASCDSQIRIKILQYKLQNVINHVMHGETLTVKHRRMYPPDYLANSIVSWEYFVIVCLAPVIDNRNLPCHGPCPRMNVNQWF